MAHADRAELEHWLAHRNAEAFRGIVSRHAAMVYTTCRRILQNADDAEDVTQECFESLAQAENLPRTTYLGAWLHGIATNRSLDRIRKDVRRERREARYMQEQPLAHTPEWNDIYDLVDEAIAELPEELRSPLVAHYLEGRTHRAIAAALGIPRRTVTNRIARGLAKLCETLRSRGVTIASAVLAALLAKHAAALTLPSTLAASLGKLALVQGSAVTTGTTVAASAAFTKAFIALAFVIAAIAAAWWWNGSSTSPAQSDTIVAAADAIAASPPNNPRAVAPKDAALPKPTTTPQAPTPDPPDYVLLCEVVRADGTPVPNAEVTLTQGINSQTHDPALIVDRKGSTDDRGEVLFEHWPDDSYVLIAHDGRDVAIAADRAYYYRRERLVLAPADTLQGTVKNAAGEPVPNAMLCVAESKPNRVDEEYIPRFIAGTTDDKGAFQFPLLHGIRWKFHVKADGYPLFTTDFLDASAPSDLVLKAPMPIDGNVTVADTGDPITDLTLTLVSVDHPLDRHTVVTAGDGRFMIDTLRPGTYQMQTIDAEWAPSGFSTIVTPDTKALPIPVVSAASISGQINETTSGNPLPDIDVVLGRQPDFIRVARVRADAQGRFTFTSLSPGPYVVSLGFDHPYTSRVEQREEIDIAPGEARVDVNFSLTDPAGVVGIVTGYLRDIHGKPLPNAIVYSRTFVPSGGTPIGAADEHGAFQLRNPITRDLRLRAIGPNVASDEIGPLALSTEGIEGLEITLKPAGSISGRLVTTSKRPFNVAPTYLDSTFVGLQRTFITSACRILPDGFFRLPDLPAGEHPLTLDLPAYRGNSGIARPVAVVSLVTGEAVTGLEIPFDDVAYTANAARMKESMNEAHQRHETDAWGAKGRVIAADTGKPVTSYILKAHRYGHQTLTIDDQDGRFEVQPAESPNMILEVLAPGYAPYRETVQQAQAVNQIADVEIRVQPGPIIEGIVVDESGIPVSGVRIFPGEMVDEHEATQARFPVTGPDGAFRLDCIEPKPQRIFAEHPSYAIGWIDVTPEQGTNQCAITLTHGGSIEGLATMGGEPLPGIRIGYSSKEVSRRQFAVSTDAEGRFAIQNLVPGQGRISASPNTRNPDGRPSRWRSDEVVVEEGKTTTLEIAMDSATSRIEGNVTYHGEPAPSASVRPGLRMEKFSESLSATVENGVYRTEFLPPGEITVYVEVVLANHVRLKQEHIVHVGKNEIIQLDVDFPGRGAVEGFVEGLGTKQNAMVVALEGDQPLPDDAAPQQEFYAGCIASSNTVDGAYTLEGLEPGTYTIRVIFISAVADSPRSAQATITITDNERIPLDFTLE